MSKERKGLAHVKYQMYKHGAKSRKLEWDITKKEFMTLWGRNCTYCDDVIETIGIDRVDNDLGYTPDNIVPCCTKCNIMKHVLDIDTFYDQIQKIYRNMDNE